MTLVENNRNGTEKKEDINFSKLFSLSRWKSFQINGLFTDMYLFVLLLTKHFSFLYILHLDEKASLGFLLISKHKKVFTFVFLNWYLCIII